MANDNVFAPSNAEAPAPTLDEEGAVEAQDFDLFGIYERTFHLLRDNLGLFAPVFGVFFVFSLINLAVNVASYVPIEDESTALGIALGGAAVQLCVGFVTFFLQLGLIRMGLALDRGQEATLEMIPAQAGRMPAAIALVLVMSVPIVIGLCLFVIPGVYIAVALTPVLVVFVDRQGSLWSTLEEAWALTEGRRLWLFVQALVLGIATGLGGCFTLTLATPIFQVYGMVLQAVTYRALMRDKAV